MRRFLAAFLLLIFILIGSGCNQASKKSSSDGASVSPQPSKTQEDANEERPKEKNHEIPSEKVYFNHSLHYVELPFVEVLELVGATVNWESETRATVSIDNRCFTLDTKEYFFKENGDLWNWFAPPPGANPYADDYPYIKDCFVLDNRVFRFLLDELGFTLTVDFEAETVHISRQSTGQSPSVPYHENDWCGIDWEKLEFPVDVSDMEWSQNHAPLSSKDDALILGQAILSEFQKNERCLNYNLCVIVHSTEDNVWRFDYAPKQESAPVHVGALMCVAVDGTTGKPIAAWVEE